jgi:Domain of unknown function (DUF4124)
MVWPDMRGSAVVAGRPRRAGAAAARPAATLLRAVVIVSLLLALTGMLVPRAHAVTYKWVDDKGVVHYTDKIPTEAVDKGNVEINKQGVPVKRTDPVPTPEQRRAREQEEARQAQLAKEREEIDRRDRALLATYTTESEIDLARTRALNTIDGQVQGAASYTALLNKRKVELDAKKAALGSKPVPPALERELDNIDAELQKQTDLIAARKKEIVVVNARYDLDRKRWTELRARAEAAANATINATPTSAKR